MPQDFFFSEDGETSQVPQDFATGAPTGLVENFRQSFQSTRVAGRTDSHDLALSDAYEPVVDALNSGFRKAEGFTLVSPDRDKFFTNPYRGENNSPWVTGSGGMPAQEQRIWDEISRRRKVDPKFLGDLGATRQDFILATNARAKQQLERESDVSERATTGGTIGGFLGSMAGGFSDPVNLGTMALGAGPAKSILHAVAREAIINAGVEAATVPIVAQRRAEIGAPMTVGDAVTSILAAGAVGGIFGGGGELVTRGIKRLAKGAPLEELPDDELLAIVDHAKASDPDVKAASEVVAANADIDRQNPFDDTPSGVVRHREELARVTGQILDDGFTGSEPRPALSPSVAERLASFTDPAGPGQQEQIAALTHDIQAAMAPTPAVAPARPGMTATAAVPRDKLIQAVVGQESRGNPNAVSPKGARGTMQVMPGTNADPGFGVRPAADASESERARVGRDYLDAMMKRYDGNVSMALAAYNAGPGRVDQWAKTIGDPRRGGISEADWASRIPIKETRNYVPSVLQRAGVVPEEMPTVTLAEQVVDGEALPVIVPLHEALAEHDADDAFITTIEACLR
ncbi:hypothetical protein BH10PSE12_BH10PSE12_18820 [soil metagenome]